MRFIEMTASVIFAISFVPIAPIACFGTGSGVSIRASSVGIGVNQSSAMANAGNATLSHGSPAATNPAVALMEARQRNAQVTAEIGQARKTGLNVHAAELYRQEGEIAIQAGLANEAMLHFNDAEQSIGIHATPTMGSYSRSALGSVAPGGTEFSGAVVH